MKGLAKYGYTNIISSKHKSTMTKNLLPDLRKDGDRHTQVNDIRPEDLSVAAFYVFKYLLLITVL